MPVEINFINNTSLTICDKTFWKTENTFYKDGSYFEPESVQYFFDLVEKKNISDKKVVLDIGAQVGLYTLYAKYIPNYHCYSYEPNPLTYSDLVENCELNGVKNVTLVNKGLGEKNDKMMLHVPLTAGEMGLPTLGDTPLRFSKWQDIPVDITTIDDEFFEKNIPVHFIKFDTEGWEYKILRGGIKTILKWKPELFLEIYESNLKQCDTKIEEIFALLTKLDYRIITIKNNENFHFSHYLNIAL